MAITAKEIEVALFDKYTRQQLHWVALREVTIDDVALVEQLLEDQTKTYRSGYIAERVARNSSARPTKRRIDMLLVSHKRSGTKVPNERIALEIKVSRADFKRDTEEKRAAWRAVTDPFASVAPVVRSGCVVAAVRSATVGMPLEESAAAPFTATCRSSANAP